MLILPLSKCHSGLTLFREYLKSTLRTYRLAWPVRLACERRRAGLEALIPRPFGLQAPYYSQAQMEAALDGVGVDDSLFDGTYFVASEARRLRLAAGATAFATRRCGRLRRLVLDRSERRAYPSFFRILHADVASPQHHAA